MGLSNFIPGLNTVKGLFKGAGKLLTGDIGGAIKAVGKGLSNDWGLGIAAMLIPGVNVVAGVTFGALGTAQLGAIGLDLFGAFGSEEEGQARQEESAQQLQPPNISYGAW